MRDYIPLRTTMDSQQSMSNRWSIEYQDAPRQDTPTTDLAVHATRERSCKDLSEVDIFHDASSPIEGQVVYLEYPDPNGDEVIIVSSKGWTLKLQSNGTTITMEPLSVLDFGPRQQCREDRTPGCKIGQGVLLRKGKFKIQSNSTMPDPRALIVTQKTCGATVAGALMISIKAVEAKAPYPAYDEYDCTSGTAEIFTYARDPEGGNLPELLEGENLLRLLENNKALIPRSKISELKIL